ncbi:hypothetical protein [Streptomyces sp. NRRL S-920]|uniref:hypothetical protein n=1 Tax=Streptomyces sp. NRRL S-920 TaxID=1463921 RepID=UPI0004C63EAE|nr:hypothetical protein [Streptomyces sp. NRRL S-920]
MSRPGIRPGPVLCRSPHITFVAPVAPGDETVWFRDADGTGFELSLATVEPDPDGERVAYAWDAIAAAIGNRPHRAYAADGLLISECHQGLAPHGLPLVGCLL